MRFTRKVRTTVLVAAMLGVIGFAAPANAETVQPQAIPNASDTLYFCDYNIAYDNIAVWEWPGGAGRSGNHAFTRVLTGIGFNSIPWISSGTVNGQRWIYGAALVRDNLGHIADVFGWVGRDYVGTPRCDTTGFQTSNSLLAGSHQGDPFSSQPNMVSASFRGQTWVWGVDPFSTTRAGWVGRSWLTLSSCDSSGCFYTINQPNINLWILPGGGSGP